MTRRLILAALALFAFLALESCGISRVAGPDAAVRHEGDMGNIEADTSGGAKVDYVDHQISIANHATSPRSHTCISRIGISRRSTVANSSSRAFPSGAQSTYFRPPIV